jgi:hypothetical protein
MQKEVVREDKIVHSFITTLNLKIFQLKCLTIKHHLYLQIIVSVKNNVYHLDKSQRSKINKNFTFSDENQSIKQFIIK